MLVLVNLNSEPLNNYSLSIQESSLPTGVYNVTPLMGAGYPGELNVNEKGGFSGYKPATEIPAYGTLILKIK